MGCCQSSKSQPEMENHRPVSESNGKAGAPPLPVEEETVKEVLSETHVVKGSTQKVEIKNERMQEPKIESSDVIKPKYTEEIVSEASGFSDMGSFTESFSTTGMENKDDDDGEVNQRVPARIPRRRQNAGDISGGRIRRERSAPTRSTTTSRENRGQVKASRQVQGRTATVQRGNAGTEKGLRRDSGEISSRKSRSPARSGEVGRQGNLRSKSRGLDETGRSDGASLVKTAESGDGSGKVEKSNDDVLAEDGESLENPIVSLECFIFL